MDRNGARLRRGARAAGAAIALALLGGCAGLGAVQPWEKGTLAKPEMQLDANGLERRYANHVYFSKEGASGGAGIGGGGCGCN